MIFYFFYNTILIIKISILGFVNMYILIKKNDDVVLGHNVWCGFGYNASIESSFQDVRVLSFEKNQKSVSLIVYSTAEFALREAARISDIIAKEKGKHISLDIMPLYVYLTEISNWGAENCSVPTAPQTLIVKNKKAFFGYDIWCGFGEGRTISDSFEDIRFISSEKNEKYVCLEIFSTPEYAIHEAARLTKIIKKEHDKDVLLEMMPLYVLLRQFESKKL